MSLSAISSGTMNSQTFQISTHRTGGQTRPGPQGVSAARGREEANESSSERAREAGLQLNTVPNHKSVNLFV
jgi:hypothetical protein